MSTESENQMLVLGAFVILAGEQRMSPLSQSKADKLGQRLPG
jgi:hypothetical protein